MKSQKNEISKNMKSLKSQTKIQKKKEISKKNEKKNIQNSINVGVRQSQCETKSGSS